ncbi:hypothetical protein [Alkaliphilus sp. B6464]|uniref:hypothetical protein n=1 Tax=Alkaliphilus sp. B6464 TaxID=2731219 RepID=UPI001BA5D814|nr:hypothetical protein [Alkaliphilus sp. B6464]QUH22136.1 hypothetical protein HYG84_19710 [Alkaliphilus sp. B6464]
MKFDPKFKKFIIGVGIFSFVGFGYMLYFDNSFISKFPYKYSKIVEKSNEVTKMQSEINLLKQRVDDLKNNIKLETDNLNNQPQLQSDEKNDLLIQIPRSVDYASLLLFIEEQALLNDVVISKLDLNKQVSQSNIQEHPVNEEILLSEEHQINNTENKINKEQEDGQVNDLGTEQPNDPISNNPLDQHGIQQKRIKLIVMGDYLKVEKFVKSLNIDIGNFNYIDSLIMKRGNSEVIDWNNLQVEIKQSQNESDSMQDELIQNESNNGNPIVKNIIADLNIVLNYKEN